MRTQFSPFAMITSGWRTFISRGWFFAGSYALTGLLYVVADNIATALVPHDSMTWTLSLSLLGIISLALSFVINTLYGMGTTSFALKAHDHPTKAMLSDFWHPRPFWNYAITNVLYALAVLAGLILFIIPGVIVAIALSMSLYLVIDKAFTPVDALRESYRMTHGHWWNLLVLGFLILAINLIGAMALVVGLFVSMPVSMFALAHTYRHLSGTHHART